MSGWRGVGVGVVAAWLAVSAESFLVFVLVMGVGFFAIWRYDKTQLERRFARLADSFGREAAERIMRGEVWLGATRAMVAESIGMPADVDERVFKTKTKHVYKYAPTGRRRYAVRVMFEDGVCVGWEDKT